MVSQLVLLFKISLAVKQQKYITLETLKLPDRKSFNFVSSHLESDWPDMLSATVISSEYGRWLEQL